MTQPVPPEQIEELEELHPGLKKRTYRPTSPKDPRYNCVAWSVNRSDLFLWPGGDPVRRRGNDASTLQYWPQEYAHADELAAITLFLNDHGYTPISDGTLVHGREKVAVYLRQERAVRRRGKDLLIEVAEDPFHLALQREGGWWASKMGQSIDIEHPHAEDLLYIDDNTNGSILREWVLFFARPRRPATWCSPILPL